MTRAWLQSVLLLSLFALSAARGLAQDKPETPLFLVARASVQDPFFQESVVLMLPLYDTEPRIVIGLIVNKPTHISLSKVFPKEKSLRDRADTVYFGGPVDTESPGAVFRAAKPAKQAFHLFDDLYVTFDSDFIVDLLKKTKNDGSVRVFLGRAQWAPEQLEGEMLLRGWYSEHAESSLIFSTAPQTVWHILFQRAEPGPVAELTIR
jgi:putative transcriptional regulator